MTVHQSGGARHGGISTVSTLLIAHVVFLIVGANHRNKEAQPLVGHAWIVISVASDNSVNPGHGNSVEKVQKTLFRYTELMCGEIQSPSFSSHSIMEHAPFGSSLASSSQVADTGNHCPKGVCMRHTVLSREEA